MNSEQCAICDEVLPVELDTPGSEYSYFPEPVHLACCKYAISEAEYDSDGDFVGDVLCPSPYGVVRLGGNKGALACDLCARKHRLAWSVYSNFAHAQAARDAHASWHLRGCPVQRTITTTSNSNGRSSWSRRTVVEYDDGRIVSA